MSKKVAVVYDPNPDANGQIYIWHSCYVKNDELAVVGDLQALITALKAYWAVYPDDSEPALITTPMRAVLYPNNGTRHSALGHVLASLRHHLEREVIITEGKLASSDTQTVSGGQVVDKTTEEYDAQELRRTISIKRQELLEAMTRKVIVEGSDGDLSVLLVGLTARVAELKAELAVLEAM